MLNFILSIFSIVPGRTSMPLLLVLAMVMTTALPSFATDAFTVGCSHYKQGKFPLAKAFFTKAIQDDPTNLAAHYQLANTLFQMGDYDRSIGQYNACLHLSPDARMRAFCLSAMAQIQSLKKGQANKVASSSLGAGSVKQF